MDRDKRPHRVAVSRSPLGRNDSLSQPASNLWNRCNLWIQPPFPGSNQQVCPPAPTGQTAKARGGTPGRSVPKNPRPEWAHEPCALSVADVRGVVVPVFPAPLRLCGKPSPRNRRVRDSRLCMEALPPLSSYSTRKSPFPNLNSPIGPSTSTPSTHAGPNSASSLPPASAEPHRTPRFGLMIAQVRAGRSKWNPWSTGPEGRPGPVEDGYARLPLKPSGLRCPPRVLAASREAFTRLKEGFARSREGAKE